MTVLELQKLANEKLGEGTQLEFGRDMLEISCPHCDAEAEFFTLGKVDRISKAVCPHCDNKRRDKTFYTIYGNVSFEDKTFAQIGVPKFDIVWARNQETLIGFEFNEDAPDVLGCLYQLPQE